MAEIYRKMIYPRGNHYQQKRGYGDRGMWGLRSTSLNGCSSEAIATGPIDKNLWEVK